MPSRQGTGSTGYSPHIQAEGTARPSWTSSLLDEYEKDEVVSLEDEEDIKGIGGVIYLGEIPF